MISATPWRASAIISVKAVSEIYAPIRGSVLEVNDGLDARPETVNQDPFGDGWFFRIQARDSVELDQLLDAQAYAELCESESH